MPLAQYHCGAHHKGVQELFRTKHKEDFDDDIVGSSWNGLPLLLNHSQSDSVSQGRPVMLK